jgi:hypothetical protein
MRPAIFLAALQFSQPIVFSAAYVQGYAVATAAECQL